MAFDLLLAGGRVIDPASGRDGPADVAFAAGQVAAIGEGLPRAAAREVVDCAGALVTPGLIDLHAHVYWGGTPLGVDALRLAARSATTTFVDAGSAGAGNFLGFRAHVIEPAAAAGGPRILAFLNIAFPGIFGFSARFMVGECSDHRLLCAREAVACAEDHRDLIVGVKVRAGRIAGGSSGIGPVEVAREAADRLGLPLMAHLDDPPPGREALLGLLRRGDILTHCFRPFPNAPVDGAGQVRADMRAARARGILFDIGHGMGSFDHAVARAMLADGLAPDIISSDLHLFCVDGPAHDLPTCLSKLLAAGMPLEEVLCAATLAPARAIGREDLGRLAPGLPGDAAVLRLERGAFPLTDATGAQVMAGERLVAAGVVMGGRWHPAPPAPPAPPEPPPPARSHAEALRRHWPR